MRKEKKFWLAFFLMAIWGIVNFQLGRYNERSKWVRAVRDVAFSCTENINPDHYLHPQTDEKASIVPTPEDRIEKKPCDYHTIFRYDPDTGEHYKTCEESIPYR